jgi:hypothetical protein
VHPLDAVIDELQQPRVLRKHLLEHLANAARVLFGHCEDDRLPGKSTPAILDADVHDLFPLPAQRIAIRDEHLKVCARVVDRVRVEALFYERITIFLREMRAPNARALKACMRLVQREVDEVPFLDRLLVCVKERRRLITTVEYAERVAIDEGRGCGCKTDHASVKVFDHFGEAIEDRAVRLIEHDKVEKSGGEPLVANAHRLLCRDIEALVRVDVGGANADARFVRKVRLESVVERLLNERVAISEKEHFLYP